MNIPFSPPDITEDEIMAVADVLRSGWITTGPKTKYFETELSKYCGTKKTVCLNSATAALELSLRFFGIGPGDEVITSAYTYTASASVIAHVGAKPVLVDTALNSYEMDLVGIEKAINNKTKAIIPVDIGGVPCDYRGIFNLLKVKSNLFKPHNEKQAVLGRVLLLSDAAHSFGSIRNGMRAGALADITCFSFHAVKNLTTAEGGCVTWVDDLPWEQESIYKEFMLLSLHGQNKDALEKTKTGSWEYDVVAPYYKFNMTDIMAALGLAQLKRYSLLLDRRKEIVKLYNSELSGLDISILRHQGYDFESCRHLYMVRLNGVSEAGRNAVISKMAEAGIATNVHYKPLPLLSAYKNMGFCIADFPNAHAQYANEISLPLHTLLSNDDVAYVTGKLTKILTKN